MLVNLVVVVVIFGVSKLGCIVEDCVVFDVVVLVDFWCELWVV